MNSQRKEHRAKRCVLWKINTVSLLLASTFFCPSSLNVQRVDGILQREMRTSSSSSSLLLVRRRQRMRESGGRELQDCADVPGGEYSRRWKRENRVERRWTRRTRWGGGGDVGSSSRSCGAGVRLLAARIPPYSKEEHATPPPAATRQSHPTDLLSLTSLFDSWPAHIELTRSPVGSITRSFRSLARSSVASVLFGMVPITDPRTIDIADRENLRMTRRHGIPAGCHLD